VKGNPKADAAASAAGGSHGQTSAKSTLLSLLQMACGSSGAALDLLDQALVRAGRDELPGSTSELVAFVRAHLLGPLSEEIGPRLTMALVDDLVAELGEPASVPAQPTVPPASVARPVAQSHHRSHPGPPLGIVLVDADRVGRTSLARALVRERWIVTVVDSERDVPSALEGGAAIDVALVDASHPAATAIVLSLARAIPELPVVARSADAAHARATLGRIGLARLDVRSTETPPEELIEALRRAAGK
jgi:CheY-like chemotaxis protein